MTLPDWVRLTKLPLSVLISISALFGYCFGAPIPKGDVAGVVFGGTLLLVFAGAIFNNVQDSRLDSRMERTRVRPIPAARIHRGTAAMLAATLAILALGLLSRLPEGGWVAAWGALGLFLYNGVYTPMKRVSVLAIFPGALCGVCPPIMGWMASGRSASAWDFWVMVALLFFWQIPHFWLILLRRKADYRAAGLPSMLQWMSEGSLARLCSVWVLCFSLVASLVAVNPILQWGATRGFVVLSATAVGVASLSLLGKLKEGSVKRVFVHLNATLGLIMLAVIFDSTLGLILRLGT